MKPFKNLSSWKLAGALLIASCLALPGLAQEGTLLAPSPGLSSEVGQSDLQPGHVMSATPDAFRTEQTLVIDDATLAAAAIDLGEIVREVDDHVDFDIRVNGGVGYDTNTQLSASDEIGGWVTWVSVGASVDVGDESAMGLYYGADLVGNLFSYDSEAADGGRDSSEPMINAYVGVRGAKTNLRLSSMFRLNNGNVVDYTDTDREQRRAQSEDYNVALSGQRTLAHGYLTGAISTDSRDFDAATGLNDTLGYTGDAAWFYRPAATPKTDFGLGIRAGSYETVNNFDQSYIQPSLRVNYAYSRKTQIFGRLGYDFRDFEGEGSIGATETLVYELGARWSPTSRVGLQGSVYKDYNPSVVSGFEDFNRSGVRGSASYNMPWWSLRLGLDASFEHSNYFSTLQNVTSNRADDYWLFGTSLGRSFEVSRFLTGDVTAFYYFTSNDSTIQVNDFGDHFSGVRFGLTY